YKSCWTDNVNSRSLTGAEYRSDDMTVENCAGFCKDFRYFGVSTPVNAIAAMTSVALLHLRSSADKSALATRKSCVAVAACSTSTLLTLSRPRRVPLQLPQVPSQPPRSLSYLVQKQLRRLPPILQLPRPQLRLLPRPPLR
ncbi:MAG: hypothetical protein JWP44_4406, partial [Mucilaginibacter sp.]|nr:hypothetical protein [Mucilaginibacter sp.]